MKRILAMVLSVAIIATIAIGGTIAFLTDSDGAKNTMVTGNVEIEQYEQDRNGKDFQQNQTILPIVTPMSVKDENGYAVCENYIDKIVTVKNTGNTSAYVRTLIAIPDYTYDGQVETNAGDNVLHWNGYSEGDEQNTQYPAAGKIPGMSGTVENHWTYGKANGNVWPGNNGDWNSVENVKINGKSYTVQIVTLTEALAAGKQTAPNLVGFYLDSHVDYDHDNGYYTYNGKKIEGLTGYVDILVLSQAVQAGGFDNPWDAFEAAFDGDGKTQPSAELLQTWFEGIGAYGSKQVEALREAMLNGKSVSLSGEMTIDTDVQGPGTNNIKKIALQQNGGVFDGNNYTLTANKAGLENGQESAVIYTTGGTIKNVTLKGSDRQIVIKDPTEDVILENVTLDADSFTINTLGATSGRLIVRNSTLKGYAAYASLESATFTDCSFEENNNTNWVYKHRLAPYITTVLENCTFATGYCLDLSELPQGTKVTLDNCTSDGVKLTEANCYVGARQFLPGSYKISIALPEYATELTDCVIFK